MQENCINETNDEDQDEDDDDDGRISNEDRQMDRQANK